MAILLAILALYLVPALAAAVRLSIAPSLSSADHERHADDLRLHDQIAARCPFARCTRSQLSERLPPAPAPVPAVSSAPLPPITLEAVVARILQHERSKAITAYLRLPPIPEPPARLWQLASARALSLD